MKRTLTGGCYVFVVGTQL